MDRMIGWIGAIVFTVFGSYAAADDLDHTLGLNRRIALSTLGPELTPHTYGRPLETVSVPDQLMVPLQAVNEGLTFYAAYRAKNYRAMAAVGAMSLWGGTLRHGIDAVAGDNDDAASVEDLAKLSEVEISVLGYLWHTDGRTGSELYRHVGQDGTWKDLSRSLERMEKRCLIRSSRSGSPIYSAVVSPSDLQRAVLATGDVERITAVLRAIKAAEDNVEVERESRPVGDGAETQ